MITLQAFAARCAEHIRAGRPFIAYRHDHGSGFLKLDGGTVTEYKLKYFGRDSYGKTKAVTEKTVETQRVAELERIGAQVIGTRQVHKTPAKATVTGFRKAIAKMQKDPRTRWSLCTVECNGSSYSIDGEGVGDLIREMGL